MKNYLISICIPYRNSPEYLDELFISIKEQTYKNYEIIVCDDQSSKENREILENKLSKYFNNYTVVLGQAKGLFLARQVAMKAASGEIILNADSDDMYLGNGFFEYINTVFNYTNFEIFIFAAIKSLKADKNAKLANSEMKSIISDEVSKKFQERIRRISKSMSSDELCNNAIDVLSSLNCEFEDNELLINEVMTFSLWPPVWVKAISSSVVNNFMIDGVDNITMAEDRLYTLLMFLYSKKIIKTNYVGYYYRKHCMSITSRETPLVNCHAYIDTEKRIETILKKFPQYRYEFEKACLTMIFKYIADNWIKHNKFKEFIEEVKQFKDFQDYERIINEYPRAYRNLQDSIKLYCFNYLFSEQYFKLYFFVKHIHLYLYYRAIINSKIVPKRLKETRKVYIPKLCKCKFIRISDI